MKILDSLGNEITEYDRNHFYCIEEQEIIKEFAEIPEVKEQGHYEEINDDKKEKKIKKWVIDVPGQQGRPEFKTVKTTLRLVPFTEEEMLLDDKEKNKMRSKFENAIEERKKKRNKHTSTAQEEEIESLRNEINELKNVINLLITEKKEE